MMKQGIIDLIYCDFGIMLLYYVAVNIFLRKTFLDSRIL